VRVDDLDFLPVVPIHLWGCRSLMKLDQLKLNFVVVVAVVVVAAVVVEMLTQSLIVGADQLPTPPPDYRRRSNRSSSSSADSAAQGHDSTATTPESLREALDGPWLPF
jgi:hypothetical protein